MSNHGDQFLSAVAVGRIGLVIATITGNADLRVRKVLTPNN
jgi:hypothetical protein